jgi:integrase
MVATYLTRRNGRYHFRIRVPQDLLSVIKSKEFHRSLGTTDRRTAKALAITLKVKLESEFAGLRQQAILNSRLIQYPNGQNQAAVTHASIHPANITRQELGHGPDLAELIDAFIQERAQFWAPRTAQLHSGALRLFRDFVGPKAIGLLSRKDCKEFKLTLEKLPPKWQTRFKGMKIRDVAALQLPSLHPATVNRLLSPICAFLNWAVSEDHISANPANRLRAIDRVRADTQRSAYQDADLRFIFEKSPMYRGCEAAWKRNHPGSTIFKDARFWLPLIGLFTGMRLEEIAQLRCRDIKQVDGVWVIDVNTSDGKRLKNQNSQRLIPIHSELLKIGLLDRVEEAIATGHERLWHEFQKNKHGSYSASYSNWFGRYKRLIGLTDPKKTFHSFRHTFIDRLKQQDVPDGKIQELVGHANHSITTGRYGKPYRPIAQKEIIEALDYGLDLRELHVDQGLAE